MNMPGFDAQRCLYSSRGHYRTLESSAASTSLIDGNSAMVPAATSPNRVSCLLQCLEAGNPIALCKKICSSPPPPPPPGGGGPPHTGCGADQINCGHFLNTPNSACCSQGEFCCYSEPDGAVVCCPDSNSCCPSEGGNHCCSPGDICLPETGCCQLVNPLGTLEGNTNYVLKTNCQPIENLSVTLNASQALVSSNGWTMQLNAYNPPGPLTQWMQYVIEVSGGNMTASIQYWDIDAWNSCLPCPGTPCQVNCISSQTQLVNASATIPVPSTLASNTLPADWDMTIALNYSSGNVSGAKFTVTDNANPPNQYTATVPVPSGFWYPIVAFQTNLVGPGGGASTTFNTAAGSITYNASGELCIEGGLPDACSNTAGSQPTGESSNAAYGVMNACCRQSLTQTFGT